jgi:sugar diacid utilization regulator
MRTSAILNRQVPDQWLQEMRQHGVIDQLLASDDVIRVKIGDLQPRRAIAIRAGSSVVGSIWLAGDDGELTADADDALRRAATTAALQLTRHRVSRDIERRLREMALATLLGGGEASPAALEQAEARPGERLVVIAVQVLRRGASSPVAVVSRLVDLVTMHLESYDRHPVLATSLDPAGLPPGRAEERIYVLTGTSGGRDRSALLRVLAECVEHARKALDLELRVGVGHVVSSPKQLGQARRSAEDCLALAPPGESVVDFDEVRDLALLADVDQLVADWRAEPSVAFTALVGHDEERGTEYVRTLRCLFDSFGNVGLVAERLHLHSNTVRYRLRRITEITGIELRGDARLALELTLRAKPGR